MMYVQTIIFVILIILVLIGIGIFFWNNNPTVNENPNPFNSDLKIIRDVMINDSYLHRFLMIEIVSDGNSYSQEKSLLDLTDDNSIKVLESQIVTFNKMSGGIEIFGKALIRSFGGAISQRIASLMQKRNEILRDYYRLMRSVEIRLGAIKPLYDDDQVMTPITVDTSDENTTPKLDPFKVPNREKSNISLTDITNTTLRRLEIVTREITDSIASSFHIRDVDQSNNSKRPITHYHRLFNLINMYDKELVNQAKAYATHQYDISMNCAQSCLEITHHISDELNILMKSTYQKLQTI